ncbi:MAG: hypothetical protein JSU69_00470 [Candidatus Zixiibacteriota bacterium]|nr:MAG: hypothetical protein JSU69_00470 [candidate division Zixibacteria bacterium]
MKPDSIKGKMFLSFFDKLVIGLAALAITLIFNAQYDEYQREREQSVAVSQVHTQILGEQRNEFLDLMKEYFKVGGSKQVHVEALDEQLTALEGIRSDVQMVISNMGTIDTMIGRHAAPLIKAIDSFNQTLYGYTYAENVTSKQILETKKNELAKIRELYGDFLIHLRQACIEAIKRDMTASY